MGSFKPYNVDVVEMRLLSVRIANTYNGVDSIAVISLYYAVFLSATWRFMKLDACSIALFVLRISMVVKQLWCELHLLEEDERSLFDAFVQSRTGSFSPHKYPSRNNGVYAKL